MGGLTHVAKIGIIVLILLASKQGYNTIPRWWDFHSPSFSSKIICKGNFFNSQCHVWMSCVALIFISTLVSFHIHNFILELACVGCCGRKLHRTWHGKRERIVKQTQPQYYCILRLEDREHVCYGGLNTSVNTKIPPKQILELEQIHCTNSFLIGFFC